VRCWPASARRPTHDAGDIEAALSLEDISVGGADYIAALAFGRRRSFSYRRLPEPLLRLTVRKLDASYFGIPPPNPAPFSAPLQTCWLIDLVGGFLMRRGIEDL
jgi:hypothetical protein